MPQVALQFHAEFAELTGELIPRWLGGEQYFVALSTGSGSSFVVLEGCGIETIGEEFVPEILFRQEPFEEGVGGDPVSFLRSNPGFLSVRPGRFLDTGLRETIMGAVAARNDLLEQWRALVRRARRDLLKGAVMVGPTGVARNDPRHLFSAGALDLARSGVPMLAAAGNVRFLL